MKEFVKEGVRIRKGCLITQVPTNQPQTLLRNKSGVHIHFLTFEYFSACDTKYHFANWELIDWELLCQHWKNYLDLHAAFTCMIQKLMFSASLSCSENQDDDSSELIFS